MRLHVTIEMDYGDLPLDAATELAQVTLTARGLNVVRVTQPKAPDGGKDFAPKAGKPGSLLLRDGAIYVVWSDADTAAVVWATKKDAHDGLFYRVDKSRGGVEPFHGDGTRHNTRECGRCEGRTGDPREESA